jgi:hypothetical protein
LLAKLKIHPVLKYVLRVAIVAAMFLWLSRHVNWIELRNAFVIVRVKYLLVIMFVLIPTALVLRSRRWRALLPGGEHRDLGSFVRAYLVGTLANSLLFGKFGDLVKARVLCDSELDYGRSLGVVVVDRILEGAGLLLVFSFVLLGARLPGWAYKLAFVAGIISVATLILMRLLFSYRDLFSRVVERLLRPFPAFLADPVQRVARQIVEGQAALADYRRIFVATRYTLVVWLCEIVSVVLFLKAFSITGSLFVVATVLLVALNFGMLVPITPGSIGVYQLLCVLVLSFWGVDRDVAFAFGVVMQTVLFVPLYLAGVVCLLSKRESTVPNPSTLQRVSE